METKTKVFDVWGNLEPQLNFSYFGVQPAHLSDAESEDIFVPDVSRLHLWRQSLDRIRSSRPAPPPPEPEKPKKKKYKFPKFLAWLVPAMLSAIILFSAIGLYVFNRSISPTYIGNSQISSNMSETSLKKLIASESKNYVISFKDNTGKVNSYRLSSTGVQIDVNATATTIHDQLRQRTIDRMYFWKATHYKFITKTDTEVFHNFVKKAVVHPTQAYQNAQLSFDGDKVSIIPEQNGYGLALQAPAATVAYNISNLETKPIKLSVMNIPAPIKTANLKEEQTKLEAMINQKIVLRIDQATITVKPADIASWIDLNPVEHDETVDINVNSGKVLQYLNKVAAPYVQPARSRLIMTQSDGSQTVLDNGSDGVDIVNKDKTADDLAQQVMAIKGIDKKLDIAYAPTKTVEVTPYDKWIVVDVTAKRMYAYEGTNLVRTFLVTAGAPKTPTVLGEYKIYAKFASQDMRGSNVDGSRYFQPNVQWINYFYKDYAIHGNYWRPLSYFGNVNSSHGCVSVVNDEAKWIYDWAPVGTPVFTHD